ncbi:flagellar motor protein MotB [Cohnella caldifontis]|uniref:flagellar motor protein MotB n=1 Tax=Cohnella caldifontis TaxID=3027471 RepID=UPI0023EE1065|nr:flagellar motor protein MotB [Cohnella sp. YIM B05605]
MSKKQRHEHHEEHPDESWLLPYSDLMTLLLALFIVLYAVSSVNTAKLEELSKAFKSAFSDGLNIFEASTMVPTGDVQSPTNMTKRLNPSGKSKAELQQEEQQNLEQLQQQLDKYIRENKLDSQLDTQLNQSELLITIRDNALFASGSAAIKPEAGKLAEAIGQMLKPYSDYNVLVAGHTDNQPINTPEFPSNWDLSFKRAVNFMKILLATSGFDPKNFSSTAYGEFHPVDTNDTAAGRAKNRRVEVAILRKFTTETANPNTTLQVQNP